MQQPSISKNCPVCRRSIDGKKPVNNGANNRHAGGDGTDEGRRTERLFKHMTTLCEMKEKFIKELTLQLMNMSSSLELEDIELVKTILERNFKRLVISFKNEGNQFLSNNGSGDESSDSDQDSDYANSNFKPYQLKLTGEEIQTLGHYKIGEMELNIHSLLFSSPGSAEENLNSHNCLSHGFSIPSLNNQSAPKLKHMKMEIMGQLFRVYRSRKHLDFTSTRSYLKILAK
jgi:hypothetical protein